MRATRIIAIFTATLLIVLSAGMSWAVAQDYRDRDIVIDGAVATGMPGQEPVALGGLTSAQAKKVIEDKIVTPLMETLVVDSGLTGRYEIDPADYLTVDTDTMVERAMAPGLAASVPERVAYRLTGKVMPVTVPLVYSVDKDKLDRWSRDLERKIGRPAIDSTRTVQPNGKLVITKSQVGYSVDHRAAYAAAYHALTNGLHKERVKIAVVKPEKTENQWGKAIVVLRGGRHMWLYDNAKVVFSAPVAVGTPGHPTPLGTWSVIDKAKNPDWTNPGTAWAKSMPAYIAPGPSNPLGTRAIYLSADGIRFHGTNNPDSVGTAASHGCMRMYRTDIEALYPLVPIGIPVFILE